jgi:hypothetical protein
MATREGAVACDDAIRFLSSVAPMQDPIFLNFGMCLAAKGTRPSRPPNHQASWSLSLTTPLSLSLSINHL